MGKESPMISKYDARAWKLPKTGAHFSTSDPKLMRLYDKAERCCQGNRVMIHGRPFLREGGGYRNIWLETQPMGGAMYAVRDVETALNNVLVFMQYQRRDGRMPGMLFQADGRGLCACYDWFQGFCFPHPAMQMAAWLDWKSDFLSMVYDALKDFDDYLWRTRENADGCLTRWCSWDTGEDNLALLLENGGADGCCGGETFPKAAGRSMPWTSMEMMSWSCQSRETLADLSRLLKNGQETSWRMAAKDVQDRLRKNLWDEEKGACYERDSDGQPLECHMHSNLRCMYFGAFTRKMAETFVRRHLLNPEEFFTPLPLPSVSVSDPWFRNIPENNWSGPVQGLTWQRSSDALLNYGFHREHVLLGQIWMNHLKNTDKLTQQYDPFTGKAGNGPDGYGPTCLSALEYTALLWGIHVGDRNLTVTSVSDGTESCYEQIIGEDVYRLVRDRTKLHLYRNEKLLAEDGHGVRLILSRKGEMLERISL